MSNRYTVQETNLGRRLVVACESAYSRIRVVQPPGESNMDHTRREKGWNDVPYDAWAMTSEWLVPNGYQLHFQLEVSQHYKIFVQI